MSHTLPNRRRYKPYPTTCVSCLKLCVGAELITIMDYPESPTFLKHGAHSAHQLDL